MFASPLPPGPDLPSVTSAGAAGFVTSGTESLRRGAEQRQGLKNYPEDNPDGKLTGAYTEGTKLTGTNACPVKRLTSVDVEGSDVNLTASLDTFIAGVQGQRTQNYQTTVTPHSPQPESKDEAGAIHTGSARNPGEGIPGVTRELRRGGTMEGYGRSSYMQSALGSVFPEAYANSYVVPREGEAASLPTTSSYQVVLSDGTSYPSAVFPGGEQAHPYVHLLCFTAWWRVLIMLSLQSGEATVLVLCYLQSAVGNPLRGVNFRTLLRLIAISPLQTLLRRFHLIRIRKVQIHTVLACTVHCSDGNRKPLFPLPASAFARFSPARAECGFFPLSNPLRGAGNYCVPGNWWDN